MNARPECLPCIAQQILDVARSVTADKWLQRKVVCECLALLARQELDRTPAEVTHEALKTARRTLGVADPFEEERQRYGQGALALEKRLKERVRSAPDPLRLAVELAVAANGIDVVPLRPQFPLKDLEARASRRFAIDDYEELKEDLGRSRSVLYLLDNAGEAVLDALLLDQFGDREVTCVFRKGPGMLDATRLDVEGVGLADRWRVMDSGTEVPGVPLDAVSSEFQSRFASADLVIAKGQGNYETLVGRGSPGQPIYILLVAKCKVVAEDLGVKVGDMVLLKKE